jgi:hypothetical protein
MSLVQGHGRRNCCTPRVKSLFVSIGCWRREEYRFHASVFSNSNSTGTYLLDPAVPIPSKWFPAHLAVIKLTFKSMGHYRMARLPSFVVKYLNPIATSAVT